MTKESKNSRVSSSDIASTGGIEPYWKRVLILDDDADSLASFRFGIENAPNIDNKRFMVDAYSDSRKALLDFQPNFYDLLLP